MSIFGILLVLLLTIFGSFFGLSDDEAYYWVLSKKLSWAYAFHPPMVAWLIKLSTSVFGHSVFGVRFFAFLNFAYLIFIYEKLCFDLNVKKQLPLLFCLPGIFGLIWMMVPDVPLFFSLVSFIYLTFTFIKEQKAWHYFGFFFLSIICVLSKYSGVLIIVSTLWAIYRNTSRNVFYKVAWFVFLGTLIGVIPILIWNIQHEWASVLYQIQERHVGGEWKLKDALIRWIRFIFIQLILVGPSLFYWFIRRFLNKDKKSLFQSLVSAYVFPAILVYFIQPFRGEFKAHWSFVIWLPIVYEWAIYCRSEFQKSIQKFYSFVLMGIFFIALYIPIFNSLGPLKDVTNDFYGWDELAVEIQKDYLKKNKQQSFELVITGSRYQTASQIYFASQAKTILIPRDLKQKSEWDTWEGFSEVSESWPVLLRPVYFVVDERYSAPPEFQKAHCSERKTVYSKRLFSKQGKWLGYYFCSPI